jgi:tetratricopeptide (TPR) repeat protein
MKKLLLSSLLVVSGVSIFQQHDFETKKTVTTSTVDEKKIDVNVHKIKPIHFERVTPFPAKELIVSEDISNTLVKTETHLTATFLKSVKDDSPKKMYNARKLRNFLHKQNRLPDYFALIENLEQHFTAAEQEKLPTISKIDFIKDGIGFFLDEGITDEFSINKMTELAKIENLHHNKDADVFSGLASLAEVKNDESTALDMYKQAVEINSNDPYPNFKAALIYDRMGNTDLANQAFEKAAVLSEDYAVAISDYKASKLTK